MQIYQAFLDGKIHVPGKDLCDMSGVAGRTQDEFTVYNVMLPRRYYPQWRGNLLERRCKAGPSCSVCQDFREIAMPVSSIIAQCSATGNAI
jgi:hypothetical protein